MGTGLIYAAIVVAWAAYLVPLALRRYDEAARTRSIDTFSNAMRVLGRHQPTKTSRAAQVVAPARSVALPRVLTPTRKAEPSAPAVRPNPNARRQAARRRRRVLLTLLGLTTIVTAVAAFGLVPWWTAALPVGLVVTWLVVCRIQVRRLESADWERSLRRPARERKSARRARRVDSSYGGRTSPIGDDPDDEPTVVITAAELEAHPGRLPEDEAAEPVTESDLAEETVAAVSVATSEGGSLWDPLPVTLPTYVSKPRAPRTVRSIEFGEPGAWTSGHVEGEQTELAESAEEAEHQRAVGD